MLRAHGGKGGASEGEGKGAGEGRTHPDASGRSLQQPSPPLGAGRSWGRTGPLASSGPAGVGERQDVGFSFVSCCTPES